MNDAPSIPLWIVYVKLASFIISFCLLVCAPEFFRAHAAGKKILDWDPVWVWVCSFAFFGLLFLER